MKALFLDFGYIMYPCLKLYSSLIEKSIDSTIPAVFWQQVDEYFKLDKELYYDSKVLELLVQFLITNKMKQVPIYICVNHADIVGRLVDAEIDNIEATVIDYFSGITDSETQLDEISLLNKFNEKDWLSYLIVHNLVTSLTWYKAPNSTLINDKFNGISKSTQIKFLHELPEIMSQKYDAIFLTCSDYSMPSKFKHLYNILTFILEAQNDECSICE